MLKILTFTCYKQLCYNLQSCDRYFLILHARCNIIGLLDAVAHSDAVSKITGND